MNVRCVVTHLGTSSVCGVNKAVGEFIIWKDFPHCKQAKVRFSLPNHWSHFTIGTKFVIIHKFAKSLIFIWNLNAASKTKKSVKLKNVNKLPNIIKTYRHCCPSHENRMKFPTSACLQLGLPSLHMKISPRYSITNSDGLMAFWVNTPLPVKKYKYIKIKDEKRLNKIRQFAFSPFSYSCSEAMYTIALIIYEV